jgi:PAS domain S-box-containing protein
MTYHPSGPAKLPGIRQYLVVRIVGVLAALLLLVGVVAWFAIVRPAQTDRAALEVELATQQAAANLTAFNANVEVLLNAAREWERAGLLEPARPQQAARLLIPLVHPRPAVLRAGWADALGRRFILERKPDGWLLRNILPGVGAPESQLLMNARGEVIAEEQITQPGELPALLSVAPRSGKAPPGLQWGEAHTREPGSAPAINASIQWESVDSGPTVLMLELSMAGLSQHLVWKRSGFIAVLDPRQRLVGLLRGDDADDADGAAGPAPAWLATPADAGLPALAMAMATAAAPAEPLPADAAARQPTGRWVPHVRRVAMGPQTWTVAALTDAAQYPLASRSEWGAISAALLAFVVLATLAGARLAGQLAALTRAVAERSTRIGNLELAPQPPLRTAVSELRELIHSQDQMRAMVHDATVDLESRVQTRTAELADREAFMRTLTESSASALAVARRDGSFAHVNARWHQLFGYLPAELHELHASSVFADGAAGRAQLLALLDRDGRARDLVIAFRRKDGSVFQGLLNTTQITFDGQTAYASWITDLSPQLEASLRAQRMADEKELLLQHLQVGIAYTRGGTIVHANAKLAEVFGFASARSMEGLALRDLVMDEAEFRELEALALPRLLAGQVFTHEWHARRQDGSGFEVHARAQSITPPTDETPGSSIWLVDDITERKAERRALEETSLYNEVLFQESHWAIVVVDPATQRISDCNAAAVRIYGCTVRDEVLGKSLLDFSAPLQYDGKPSATAMDAMQRDSSGLSDALAFIWRHVRPDGQEWDAIVHAMPLRIGGRALLQFTLDDVTTERATRRHVAELNAFLQAMLDRMPNAVFYKGADSRLLGCNRRFEEMFGVPRADFLGKRIDEMDIAPPEFLATLQREDEQLIAQAGHVQREMRLRFATGKLHHTLYSASGFQMQDGTPGGLVGVIVDIDPLRRAERAIIEANAEQLAIFESTSMGICLVQGSIIRRCNRSLEEIFGYAEGEMTNQSTRIWYPSEAEFVQGRDLVHAKLGTPHRYRHDLRMRRKDGHIFWCRLSGSYIDARDPQRGSVWTLEDVTDETEAAEALREAKRQADDATRAKSMFLANMSHEIRTPLNSIIGMSYLALRTHLDERQRAYVAKVHGAGTALLAIINDLLDFSRVDAGRLELERSAFRFDEVLDNVASQVAQKAYDKGLELFFDTARDVPPDLIGDPLRLGQVIANLVGNAIKFTEGGQISVTVRVRERKTDTVMLQVAVRDTGIGMSDEQIQKLFQAFTQADGSNTRRHGGTGLGLTLCKRLVEMMDGSISVESAPDQGSLFWFTAQLGLGAPTSTALRFAPGLFTGMQALVAEDNESLREILCAQLGDLGFEVQGVESGQRALDALLARTTNHERRPFDVLLVDWKMPGLDGIETARRVRQAGLPLHIVMATAYGGDPAMRQRAEEVGVDVFLIKPVSQSSMVDALVRAFVPRELAAAGQADAASGSAAAAGPAGPLQNMQILLADDDEAALYTIAKLLRQAGAVVETVHNGLQAVELAFRNRNYSAILLDLQMPQLDGFEATTRLRADARLERVPIIGLAAHAAIDERSQATAAGMTDLVAKPVDAAGLLRTLQRWLSPGQALPTLALPSPDRADETTPAADHVHPDDHVARMKALLTAGDSDAVDYLEAHAPTWRTLFGDSGFGKFERSLEEFDFDQALHQLQFAKARKGAQHP